ncbi:MAG TPA: CinA family protein [Acidimicrobiales bacterium]|nr:CinA family protein [Acidimicrobiales bacterium]
MFDERLSTVAEEVASRLVERGETIAVAEGSCGGLVSASLLGVAGASRFYLGGAVVYTPAAARGFVRGEIPAPAGMRGATETFAAYLATSVRLRLGATWGIGEGGATGPSPNPYGDPPGHAWLACDGPVTATRHLLTGESDRRGNMVAFATSALELLLECVATPRSDL